MKYFILLFVVTYISACQIDQDFVNDSMKKFDDQAYKDAISLVELHKIRNGVYPSSLKEIEFSGDWDMINQDNIVYSRKRDGYILSIKGMQIDSTKYPEKFYRGLGLLRE